MSDMAEGAENLKDKAENLAETLTGGVAGLLAGIGPPWALKVIQGDAMGALESMLEGLGVSLDFEPGGLGFASYGALEKLYHSDIDGASLAMYNAVLDELPKEVGDIIRQLLEADTEDWFDIIKDGVFSSLAEGMLRESVKSLGVVEPIVSQLYNTFAAI